MARCNLLKIPVPDRVCPICGNNTQQLKYRDISFGLSDNEDNIDKPFVKYNGFIITGITDNFRCKVCDIRESVPYDVDKFKELLDNTIFFGFKDSQDKEDETDAK